MTYPIGGFVIILINGTCWIRFLASRSATHVLATQHTAEQWDTCTHTDDNSHGATCPAMRQKRSVAWRQALL